MAQWIEGRYNGSTLDLGLISISVYWAIVPKGEPGGYQYRYGTFTSKKLYKSMDEAKKAAIESVDVRLAAARREIAEQRALA